MSKLGETWVFSLVSVDRSGPLEGTEVGWIKVDFPVGDGYAAWEFGMVGAMGRSPRAAFIHGLRVPQPVVAVPPLTINDILSESPKAVEPGPISATFPGFEDLQSGNPTEIKDKAHVTDGTADGTPSRLNPKGGRGVRTLAGPGPRSNRDRPHANCFRPKLPFFVSKIISSFPPLSGPFSLIASNGQTDPTPPSAPTAPARASPTPRTRPSPLIAHRLLVSLSHPPPPPPSTAGAPFKERVGGGTFGYP